MLARPFLLLPWLVACGVPAPSLGVSPDAAAPTVRVAVSGNALGRITSEPAGIDCPGTCEARFPRGTHLVLAPRPAEGARFTGWRGGASGELDLTDAEVDLTALFHGPENLAFVTSQTWKGDLGGLAGADARCEQAAAQAGLPPGPYVAFLSDGTADVAERLRGNGWVRPDGRPVALSAAALLAGELLYAPRLDEHGVDRGHDPARVFVGRHGDQAVEPTACDNWTRAETLENQDERGHAGSPDGNAHTWARGVDLLCGESARLYCFGNDPAAPPPAPPAPAPLGSRVWVSTLRFQPGSGRTPSSVCEEDAAGRPLVAATAIAAVDGEPPVGFLAALVNGSCRAANGLVRSDGVVVARHPVDLWRPGAWLAAVDRHADGSLVAPGTRVWLGATGVAERPTRDCHGWTSTDHDELGLALEVSFAGTQVHSDACSEPLPVLCMEHVVSCTGQ